MGNEKMIFAVDAAFDMVKKGAAIHMEPKFAIATAHHKLIALKGALDIAEGGKTAVDLQLESAFIKAPITLAGTFKMAGALSTMNLVLATPIFTTSIALSGNLGAKKMQMVTKYTLWHMKEQTIEFVGQAAFKKLGKLTVVDFEVDPMHSAFPAHALKAQLATHS